MGCTNPILAAAAAAAILLAPAPPAAVQPTTPDPPRQHKSGWPALVSGANPAEFSASLDLCPNLERGRSARFDLAERNRLLILPACYSGLFVPALWSDTTALFTAASAGRTSFGCAADNDWAFFGDAPINRALRKPQPLAAASQEALRLVSEWEAGKAFEPSYPQVSVGSRVQGWLGPLEARMPKTATQPVGKPAVD